MADSLAKITNPKEIADLGGVSERTIHRLAASGEMPGVTLKVDGYHNEYRLTDDLLEWIAQRKRKPRGGVAHEPNVQKAMQTHIMSIMRASEILEALQRRVMADGDGATVERLRNVLEWARREGGDLEFPPIGPLNHFLHTVPSDGKVEGMTAKEAGVKFSEGRPILRYLHQFSNLLADSMDNIRAGAGLPAIKVKSEVVDELVEQRFRHYAEAIGGLTGNPQKFDASSGDTTSR